MGTTIERAYKEKPGIAKINQVRRISCNIVLTPSSISGISFRTREGCIMMKKDSVTVNYWWWWYIVERFVHHR
jgi:hypothetical protein